MGSADGLSKGNYILNYTGLREGGNKMDQVKETKQEFLGVPLTDEEIRQIRSFLKGWAKRFAGWCKADAEAAQAMDDYAHSIIGPFKD